MDADMREVIEALLNSDESAYSISQATNVDDATIRKIRNGQRKLDNITLQTAEKLYQYATEKEGCSHE